MTECWLQDVESANMFIGSLIFVQELAEKVVEVRFVLVSRLGVHVCALRVGKRCGEDGTVQ